MSDIGELERVRSQLREIRCFAERAEEALPDNGWFALEGDIYDILIATKHGLTHVQEALDLLYLQAEAVKQ